MLSEFLTDDKNETAGSILGLILEELIKIRKLMEEKASTPKDTK